MNSGNSRNVDSSQSGIHQRLAEIVAKHQASVDRTPIQSRDRAALERWLGFAKGFSRTAFDAGCGTGESALALARRQPGTAVLGVDQSAHRLAKTADRSASNALLLRADCAGVWRVLAESGAMVDDLYLWYPNPWPKAQHLMRRWHAHPVFPALIATARRIELRTNWSIYAEEFAFALRLLGVPSSVEPLMVDEPVSPFERKYWASGHALWRVAVSTFTPALQLAIDH